MPVGQRTPGVLPATADMLALLRQLAIRPRTLPVIHELLALTGQVYGQPVAAIPRPAPRPVLTPAVELGALSVAAFFARVPWEHVTPTPVAVPRQSRPRVAVPAYVPARVDRATIVRPPRPVPEQPPMVAGDMPVRAFFAAVPWDATAVR